MKLKETLELLAPHERLIIRAEGGQQIYRGYVGNTVHHDIDMDLDVTKIGISTGICRKTDREKYLNKVEEPIEDVLDQTKDISFSDLEFFIYILIETKK